ncbi:MAG: LacI family DNA-binding transcriptional regulator [Opitutales bacterium]
MTPSPQRITLDDIAREAGVSKNTVSVALRNRPGVGEETRARIRAIADKLGYRPNPMISALMRDLRGRQPGAPVINLAFLHVFEDPGEWENRRYVKETFMGAERRATQLGYHLSPLWIGQADLSPKRIHGILQARGVEGLLLAPLPENIKHLHLHWEPYAVATLGYSLMRPAVDRACTHMRHSLEVTVRELRKLGYRRIGLVISPESDRRTDYAWTAAHAVQVSLHPKLFCPPMIAHDVDPKALSAWLQTERPDVVIRCGARNLGKSLEDLNIRPPEDLGYVDLLASGSPHPDNATMYRLWDDLGAAAMEILSARLMQNERGIPVNRRTLLVEGTWHSGTSLRKQRKGEC